MFSKINISFATLAASTVLVAMVVAQNEPAATPLEVATTKPSTRAAPPVRIPFPYQRIESLTKEQKEQIVEIRRGIARELEAIRAKEREAILAVLTPEQREEAAKLVAAAQEREASERAAREATRPATRPTK